MKPATWDEADPAQAAAMPSVTRPNRRCLPKSPLGSAQAPLAALAETDLAGRFRHWRGASGRRYLFSVFPLGDDIEALPRFEDAVVLAAARLPDEERAILCIDDTGSLPDLFYASRRFREAVGRGADEVHVHLLSRDSASRAAVLRDLRACGAATATGAPVRNR